MKARIYILEGNALGLPSGGETYNSLKEALANLPIGYKIARYGYDSHVIVKASHDFEAERYGEIGYVYTGSAA